MATASAPVVPTPIDRGPSHHLITERATANPDPTNARVTTTADARISHGLRRASLVHAPLHYAIRILR